MDFNKLVARGKAILLTPKSEWPVISAESDSVAGLYRNYIVWLAAIPAVFGFIKGSLIGYGAFGIHMRSGIGAGLVGMVTTYLLTLIAVYVIMLIIDALAPTFGAQKNQVQALKVVGYAFTASWLAGIGLILPWIGGLIAIVGGIYSIYLLYLGLPATMKCAPEKAVGYTAVTVVISIVLMWVLAIVSAGMTGVSRLAHPGFADSSGSVEIDKDSTLGKLDAWTKKMQAASDKLEQAQKSGDSNAQGEALGNVIGTALTGGAKVEALAPDMLKPFVPATLAGWSRSDFSAERNGAMGMQVSTAKGTYKGDGGQELELEITDMGSAKGLLALAGFANVAQDRETDHGYEKTYRADGRLIHEEWDGQSHHGEYGIVLGDRFTVKVSGNADSIDRIKQAVASIDLAGLERLKDQGVTKD